RVGAAYRGLAFAERIPRKTEIGREVVLVRFVERARALAAAGLFQHQFRVVERFKPAARQEAEAVHLTYRVVVVVAQTEVQRQVRPEAPGVAGVKPQRVILQIAALERAVDIPGAGLNDVEGLRRGGYRAGQQRQQARRVSEIIGRDAAGELCGAAGVERIDVA